MGKIKIGIIGTGYTVGQASAHVTGFRSFPSRCVLTALYDIVPGRAQQWANEKKLDVIICQSEDELLDLVDAVSIVTPNFTHSDVVIKALRKGKHVLCEKPISIDVAHANEMVAYSKTVPVITMIGFSYRGIPALKWMKQKIDEGALGKIFTWRETLGGCRIANPKVKLEWRMQEITSGTGALADFGCHMIDLCDWVIGDNCGGMEQAQCMTSTSITERKDVFFDTPGRVTNDDNAAFQIKFANGAIASFLASRLGVIRHTIEVYGEGGMMAFRDDHPDEVETWFKEKEGGYSGKSQWVKVPDSLISHPWFNEEIGEFLDCIENHKKPERNFERALYIQTIIDRLAACSKSGETAVIKGGINQ